jgi:arylsulfatase A-like enzyme
LGDNEQQNHRYLYWEFHEQGGKQAVRIGKWKAIRLQAMTAMPAPIELYDLELDPFEKNNMAAEHPEIIKQAEDCMKQAHRESEVFPFLIR